MAESKKTFTMKVYNNRGKLLDSRETSRGNQRYAHRLARVVIRDYPSGSRLDLLDGSRKVEEFKMHPDGYTFEVLNGDNVQSASRKLEGRKANSGVPVHKATSAIKGRSVKKPARKAARRSTRKLTAEAPF